jgi:uncharacterized protein (TIGR03435 family)
MRNGLLSAMSAGVVLAAGMFFGHVRAAGPEFEVANITPAAQPTPELFRSGKIHIGMTSDATRVDIGGMPLTTAIQQAFRVKPFQVAAPDWARDSRWDILAKIPEGGSQAQIPEMLQALLADRFKLAIHHEQREQPVYELVVGKGGPKLEASEAGDETGGNATGGNAAGGNTGPQGFFPGAAIGGLFGGGAGNVRVSGDGRGAVITGGATGTTRITPNANCGIHMEFSKLTMQTLADTLTTFLDRPVVDGTELKGNYKIALDLPMEVMLAMMQNMVRSAGLPPPGQFGGPGGPGGGGPGGRGGFGGGLSGCPDPGAALGAGASDTSNAPIFQAVQRLGLKLQARKAPFDTIVVDHLEKTPTEN